MPVPIERLVLLSLSREKIKKQGHLLCYHWRDIPSNPSSYTEENELNDGYFKGKGKEYKTFHAEWERDHVFEMMISAGFSLEEKIKLGNVGNNQAYVFKPDQPILLDKYLELSKIRKGEKRKNAKRTIPETGRIYFPHLYLEELKKVSPGRKEACKFHRISARLIKTIFDYQLKNPVIEKEINEGRGYIDIKFTNRNKPGFFKNIKEMNDIKCPSVFVECKNYTYDVANPEFNQLAGRLNSKRGMFGLLICRKKTDKKKILSHCRDKLKDNKYIIVLDDKNMSKLAYIKMEKGDEGVDDYMQEKLDKIID